MLSRRLLLGGALAAPFAAPFATRADAWPAKPIRVVLPGPAGGLIDVAARAVSEVMLGELGQPLIIDPRPGGNGVVAGQAVTGAAPDGYTLMLTVSAHVALPFLMKVPFDVVADFTPVAMLGVSSALFCVPPSLPVANLAELVDYARARPGKLNYLDPGNGTGAHLIPEQLKIRYGIDIASISYRGLPPGMQDLLGGRIELGVVSTSLIVDHAKSGAVKAIAVVGPSRVEGLPDVSTMEEQGLGDMEVRSALPLYGPKGLPAPIVQRLAGAVGKALNDSDVKRRLGKAYIDATPMSPAETGAAMAREHERLGKLIAQLGIKADGGS
jgi:tripartite-type tricarboxylate transporter receptor subunit TctC